MQCRSKFSLRTLQLDYFLKKSVNSLFHFLFTIFGNWQYVFHMYFTWNVLKNEKRDAVQNSLLAEAKVKQMKFLRSKEDVKSFPPIYWPLSGHWITFHKPLPPQLLYDIHYLIYSTTPLLYSTISAPLGAERSKALDMGWPQTKRWHRRDMYHFIIYDLCTKGPTLKQKVPIKSHPCNATQCNPV